MVVDFTWISRTMALLLGVLSLASSQRLECPRNETVDGLASQMLEGIIARGQGLEVSDAVNGLLEIGFFQQAVHESIAYTNNTTEKRKWEAYLEISIRGVNSTLANATKNTYLPLDRLSAGIAMIRLYNETQNAALIPTIKALQQSVGNQKRNTNGGLWSFDNQLDQSAHRNLSSIDGMYAFAPFAILSREFDYASDTVYLNEAAAWKQVSLLESITKRTDGLLVHGYDPTKNHSWAQGESGISPVVWSQSLALFTLGVVNSIELLETQYSDLIYNFKDLYRDLVAAQLEANQRSLAIEGSFGVWQVVDRPGASFEGTSNFIEASSSLMTAYSLLKGARLGWIEDEELKSQAEMDGVGMFQEMRHKYLVENANDTLSLDGTSSVVTLSGDVDYEYYVTRPTILNSLIGTSAFVLAALEVEQVC